MRAEKLIESVLMEINKEIEAMRTRPEHSSLIDDIIDDDLDLNNYNSMIDQYIDAIDKLLTNEIDVKFNIKNILFVLKCISIIDDDIEINEDYKVCITDDNILQELYIDNHEIRNIYLKRSKNLIISKPYEDFSSYLEQLDGQSYLYILKALFDNFNCTIEPKKCKVVYLANCYENKIEIFKKNNKELVSYLKLCILADGKSFHKHYSLANHVSTVPPYTKQNKNYYQYNEIFYILSEYNYSNDLLNKYFLLYTIIENFMYRHPISKMLRNHSREFSIRDFKRLYSSIDSNESQKITELISSVFDISVGEQKFYDELKNNLTIFLDNNNIDENKLMRFLIKIGVSNKNGKVDRTIYCENLNKYFAKTIYHLRNSILHNTATEFHITHYELSKNDTVVQFLEKLIIPFLEKVILYLIHESHDIISYEKDSLLLY